MKQFKTPFIEPNKVQPTFFESLTEEERKFYGPIFASLRKSNNQWLALALYNYREYGVMSETNRNPFMQTLFEAILEAEDNARFEEKTAKLGAIHEANLDDLSVRLKRWFFNSLHFSFHKA